jgi:hypothetical protein
MNERQPSARNIFGSLLSSYSRSRRLEDRIRRLCSEAVTAAEPAELNPILEQLSAALRNHTERVRQLATMRPTPPDRRRV